MKSRFNKYDEPVKNSRIKAEEKLLQEVTAPPSSFNKREVPEKLECAMECAGYKILTVSVQISVASGALTGQV